METIYSDYVVNFVCIVVLMCNNNTIFKLFLSFENYFFQLKVICRSILL